ncbi:MAG: DUF29 domain-containing protein [Microcystis sp.]|uniref:DUF29 domain-containing protein n=1 Tax=Microcystis sp. TaxID=1127 RepID=UPI003919D901
MLSTAKKLYDTDFNLWVEETANLLKEGKWEYLDLENLIEEIEAMGRSDKKALKSNLEKLLGLRHFRAAKKAQTITGQRVNLNL